MSNVQCPDNIAIGCVVRLVRSVWLMGAGKVRRPLQGDINCDPCRACYGTTETAGVR